MTSYRTIVTQLPATPLGLLPPRWTIEHHCTTCRQIVTPDELVTHAEYHHEHDRVTSIHHQGGAID